LNAIFDKVGRFASEEVIPYRSWLLKNVYQSLLID